MCDVLCVLCELCSAQRQFLDSLFTFYWSRLAQLNLFCLTFFPSFSPTSEEELLKGWKLSHRRKKLSLFFSPSRVKNEFFFADSLMTTNCHSMCLWKIEVYFALARHKLWKKFLFRIHRERAPDLMLWNVRSLCAHNEMQIEAIWRELALKLCNFWSVLCELNFNGFSWIFK
jgi:hypothetical protein